MDSICMSLLLLVISKFVTTYGKKNGFSSRLLGFSLFISNSTKKKEGILCFKDTNHTRATIPNPINITCSTSGRYVIYYNNRTHSPYPSDYSVYAYNELCEVEVYGYPVVSYNDICPRTCYSRFEVTEKTDESTVIDYVNKDQTTHSFIEYNCLYLQILLYTSVAFCAGSFIVNIILVTRVIRIMILKKEKHVDHVRYELENINATSNNVHAQPEVNAIYQELIEFNGRLHYDQLR